MKRHALGTCRECSVRVKEAVHMWHWHNQEVCPLRFLFFKKKLQCADAHQCSVCTCWKKMLFQNWLLMSTHLHNSSLHQALLDSWKCTTGSLYREILVFLKCLFGMDSLLKIWFQPSTQPPDIAIWVDLFGAVGDHVGPKPKCPYDHIYCIAKKISRPLLVFQIKGI